MRWGAGLAVAIMALLPGVADAAPVVGQRQTVELSFTTTTPGAPSGFTYRSSIRNPSDPAADPPPLRRLLIGAPSGARLDTAAVVRCQASDAQLRERGEAACPAASTVGSGFAVVKPLLLPPVRYRATAFNYDGDQVELLAGDPPTPSAIVHGYVRGELIDSPIPTCLSGGFAPRDCPTDQVALRSSELVVPALAPAGRGYFTTPPTCPASGRWWSPVTFQYGDGVNETLGTEQPCVQPARTQARLTLLVAGRRASSSRRLRRLRVRAIVRGAEQAAGVRAALRRVRGGRPTRRILARTRTAVTVRGHRTLVLKLRRAGLHQGRYEVAARGRGVARVVRRFTVR